MNISRKVGKINATLAAGLGLSQFFNPEEPGYALANDLPGILEKGNTVIRDFSLHGYSKLRQVTNHFFKHYKLIY